MLVRAPEELTVLDVVQAVDPLQRIEVCPLGLKSHGANLCPLHRRLDQAIATVEAAFRESSLAELVRDRQGEPGPCARPARPPRGAEEGGDERSMESAPYTRYFAAAIATVVTVGAGWGVWLLWQVGMAGRFTGVSLQDVNAARAGAD